VRFVIFALLISIACAHDAQLSVYSAAQPSGTLNPGYGVELGTTVGNRTAVGVGLALSEPRGGSDRDFSVQVEGRLLYGSELNTHWYPLVGTVWQVERNEIRPWIGAGFQRQLIPEVGIYSDALWQPYDSEVQFRLGIRIWLERFTSLDARVRSADPVGVVYQGGVRAQSKKVSIEVQEPVPPVTVTEEQGSPSVVKPGPAQPVVSNLAEDLSQAVPEPIDSWYLHLGLFRQQESMRELEGDPRLEIYQARLQNWFDERKGVFRLLLGPMSKSEAERLKFMLLDDRIDSFLYQIPQ